MQTYIGKINKRAERETYWRISMRSISPEKEKNSWISLSVARSETCPTCTVLIWEKKREVRSIQKIDP